ncbi:MAG: DapH/DapD/GlmU-related protein [Christensenellales bacterium]
MNDIDKSAQIDKFCVINNSKIESGCKVLQSYIEDSIVKSGTTVGPFAHIRPNSQIGKNCKIGNFVEIKNSIIGDGTKISHLAYVGDAVVGKNCNIGCGVIFANYNGRQKNKIEIGDNVFVGSNCNLIAPLKIESNVYICAGTTVTQDLKADDFVIGRVKQVVKQGRANNYLKNNDNQNTNT